FTSIPQVLADYDHLDASLNPLVSGHHVAAANAGRAAAAGGHAGLSLCQRHAFPFFPAVCLAVEPYSIGRRSGPLHPVDSFVYVLYYLVVSRDDDDRSGAVAYRSHPVAVAVHVIQFAVLGDRVGTAYICIRAERFPVYPFDVFTGQPLPVAVQEPVIP